MAQWKCMYHSYYFSLLLLNEFTNILFNVATTSFDNYLHQYS